MTLTTLKDALHEELKDLYSAEQQLVAALPVLAASATDPALKAGFEEHLAQTETHVKRLEQAFQLMGQEAEAHTCQAMKGLIKEGNEIAGEQAESTVLDAMLIAAAQKVEHYEIASYGTVCTWAEMVGLDEIKELLGQTLEEEKATDEKLTSLAEASVNANAE